MIIFRKKPKIILIILGVLIFLSALIILGILVVKENSKETNYADEINIKWNLNIPLEQESKAIYRYDFSATKDFHILKYDKSKDLLETLNEEQNFTKIETKYVSKLKEILKIYYESLDESEKKLFDANVNIENLLQDQNYYIYREITGKNYLLLVMDPDEHDIYYFNSNI